MRRNCSKRGGPSYGNRRAPPTESAAVSSLMVTGLIEGECVEMLIDTGSAVIIIREDVWRRSQESHQLQLQLPIRSVVAANGEELDLLGQSEVTLGIGGLAVKHLVLVAKGLTQECLLGANFLMQHSCVVDLQKMKLFAGGTAVSFVSQPGSNEEDMSKHTISCHVTFPDTIVVPEYCQMQLSVSVKGHQLGLNREDDAILEPEADFVECHGLLAAHSLFHCDQEKVTIQLLNPSPAPVAVRKHEKVETLEPLAKKNENVCVVRGSLECNQPK